MVNGKHKKNICFDGTKQMNGNRSARKPIVRRTNNHTKVVWTWFLKWEKVLHLNAVVVDRLLAAAHCIGGVHLFSNFVKRHIFATIKFELSFMVGLTLIDIIAEKKVH